MEWKKDVNTNLGITIILVFAALFTIVDFYVIGAHMDGYPFNDINGTVAGDKKVVENNDVVEEEDVIEEEDVVDKTILSEEEALNIGDELYKKASQSYYGIYEKKGDGLEYAYYSKLQDDFFQSDELGHYRKLLLDDMRKVFSSEMFDNLYYIKNAYYIVGSDNNYYMEALSVGGNPTYIDSKLSIIDIHSDVIMFNVSSYYNVEDYDDLDEIRESKFSIKKENGEWKVSNFTLPF